MKTISQVAKLTGVSIRTLQYYDEIGLLKPSELTPVGYRLYDEHALQTLQQILFFRELDFSLKDIIKIMQNPDFDRIAAFKKQKELLLLKRNRTDRLIQLLERLEKGEEPCFLINSSISETISCICREDTSQVKSAVSFPYSRSDSAAIFSASSFQFLFMISEKCSRLYFISSVYFSILPKC